MTSSMASQGGLKVGPLYLLKTGKDIIIELPVHRYHEFMTTII